MIPEPMFQETAFIILKLHLYRYFASYNCNRGISIHRYNCFVNYRELYTILELSGRVIKIDYKISSLFNKHEKDYVK